MFHFALHWDPSVLSIPTHLNIVNRLYMATNLPGVHPEVQDDNSEEDHHEFELMTSLRVPSEEKPFQHELKASPLFTRDAFHIARDLFPKRGFLASILRQSRQGVPDTPKDARLYVNTQAPFSAVICGAQVR